MEKLKEYAGVIVAATTVAVALSGLVVWLVQVQIVPEIRRLDGRIHALQANVSERLERMDNRLDVGLTRLEREMGSRFDGMGSRFDGMGSRFDGMGGRLDRVEQRLDRIEQRLDGMGGRLDRMGGRLDGMEQRFDARFARIEGDIKTILLRLPGPNEPDAAQVPTPTAH